MTNLYTSQIISLQKAIFQQTVQRTDAHYSEGQGVLFVPEGHPLIPANVIHAAPQHILEWL